MVAPAIGHARCPLLIAALWVVASCVQAGGNLPERFSATFTLHSQGFEIAETRWELSPRGDGRYLYESSSRSVGVARMIRDERIEERSEWRYSGGRVQPLHYTYSRAGGKREREVEVRFDWRDRRIRNIINGEAWSMPLAAGTLDKLVYLLAVMHDLANGLRDARYAVADGGKLKTYRITRLREERVDTVLGPLDTVVVRRTRRDRDRVTLIWCARSLHYLPVKVEHRESDEVVLLTLKSLRGIEPR